MKLTIVGLNYSPEPTGIAVYTSGLADAMVDHGDSVRVLAGVPHYPQWRVYEGYERGVRRERVGNAVVDRLRHFVPRRPKVINRMAMELHFGLRAALAGWNRPEVALLVTPALLSTALASIRARILGVPTCIWVQDIYSLGLTQSGAGGRLAATVLRRVERRVLQSGSTIVVIHERFKRYLVDELGLPADRIEVVRNWSHLPETVEERRAEIRRGLGWNSNDIVVLHAGNMGAKQGLENVVEASRLAAATGSPVRFVLLGDGNQRESLEAMGSNDNLQFIDPLNDAAFAPTLSAADILLVNERPGLTEMSVPSKLTSYFSTGLPVIAATDRSSVTAEEMALSGGGVRVDAADPSALLGAAEELGGNAESAHTYGTAGREFRSRYLTQEAAVDFFRSILTSMSAAANPISVEQLSDMEPSGIRELPLDSTLQHSEGARQTSQLTTTARNSTRGPST